MGKEKEGVFSLTNEHQQAGLTQKKRMVGRIYGHGRGWAFSQKDFADLGPRATTDFILHDLCERGTIRRVIRGIYDYPAVSELLGVTLSPDFDQVARALARKHRWTIQPHGETALHVLGLSTQVPGNISYLSTGPTKRYEGDNLTLAFRHVASKELDVKRPSTALVVQALKALGERNVDEAVLAKLRANFSAAERSKMLTDAKYVTSWIVEHIRAIAADPEK